MNDVVDHNIDLQTRFWNAAENTANEKGFAFTSGCESLLRELIDEGINRIVDENRLDDDASLELAETNITAFVSRMVVEAQDQELPELDESMFQLAEAALGPIWPFKQ